jgi:hypothetical protein
MEGRDEQVLIIKSLEELRTLYPPRMMMMLLLSRGYQIKAA